MGRDAQRLCNIGSPMSAFMLGEEVPDRFASSLFQDDSFLKVREPSLDGMAREFCWLAPSVGGSMLRSYLIPLTLPECKIPRSIFCPVIL